MTARQPITEESSHLTGPTQADARWRSSSIGLAQLSPAVQGTTASTLGLEALGVLSVAELPQSTGDLLCAFSGAVARDEPAVTESALVAIRHAILSVPDVGAKARCDLIALCDGALNLLDHPNTLRHSAHH